MPLELARHAVSRESQQMAPICQNQRCVGVNSDESAPLRVIVSVRKDGLLFFLDAGRKQAEEGAAEAGEEEAPGGKASAEVSPEQRKSGPEPA